MSKFSKIKKDEITILLLGQTGVGKSTWINGIINYYKYPSLSKAEKRGGVVTIPTKFHIAGETYTFESTIGERETSIDKKENQEWGLSSTQICNTYRVATKGIELVLIDTPGIGDTRGIEQDRKNMKIILDHIRYIEHIHAICILLKPNESRITSLFQFCIKELLAHIHKDASKNLFFCFTNSRTTFYGAGDTAATLEKVLFDINVDISDLNNRYVFLDNECFRYLCLLSKKDKKTLKEERKVYSQSWKKSFEETQKFMKKLKRIQPHKLQDTMTLNETRRIILSINKFLLDITQTIGENINLLELHKASVENNEELEEDFMYKQIELKSVPIEDPRTVCTNEKCTEFLRGPGNSKIPKYKICHDKCYLPGIIPDEFPDERIKDCSIFANGTCKFCACSWKKHMQVIYEIQRVERNITREELDKERDVVKQSRKIIKDIKYEIKKLKMEETIIIRNCAVFAWFLKDNAIVPYNDSVEEYLNYLIRYEGSDEDKAKIKRLESLKTLYREAFDTYTTLEGRVRDKVSPEEVHESIEELYGLPRCGEQIRLAVETCYDVQNCFADKTVSFAN